MRQTRKKGGEKGKLQTSVGEVVEGGLSRVGDADSFCGRFGLISLNTKTT